MEEEAEKGISSIDENHVEENEQQLWSWGAGTEGQLGTGRLEDEYSPQLLRLDFLSSVSVLACGGAHVLALTSVGRVFSWGRGNSGQLGHGDMLNSLYPKPITFFDGHPLTHVSAGWSHSAFVSDSGCLYTCGDGSFGQLGHGDYRSHCSPVKVSYFINKNVEQIACGMRHSLVLLKDCLGNQVYGFGSGKRGQLGISKERIKSVCLPQATKGFDNVEIVDISANGDHSAAISADGHLYTWGKGFNRTPDVSCPQCLPSSSRFTKAALGWNHALVLTGDGEVLMLGGSNHGVLSDPEKMTSAKNLSENANEAALERVAAVNGVKVVQIAAGAEHSALVTGKIPFIFVNFSLGKIVFCSEATIVSEDGTIMTWGWGEHGQLGLGDTHDQTNPQTASLGDNVRIKDTKFQVYCGSGFTYAMGLLCFPSRSP